MNFDDVILSELDESEALDSLIDNFYINKGITLPSIVKQRIYEALEYMIDYFRISYDKDNPTQFAKEIKRLLVCIGIYKNATFYKEFCDDKAYTFNQFLSALKNEDWDVLDDCGDWSKIELLFLGCPGHIISLFYKERYVKYEI